MGASTSGVAGATGGWPVVALTVTEGPGARRRRVAVAGVSLMGAAALSTAVFQTVAGTSTTLAMTPGLGSLFTGSSTPTPQGPAVVPTGLAAPAITDLGPVPAAPSPAPQVDLRAQHGPLPGPGVRGGPAAGAPVGTVLFSSGGPGGGGGYGTPGGGSPAAPDGSGHPTGGSYPGGRGPSGSAPNGSFPGGSFPGSTTTRPTTTTPTSPPTPTSTTRPSPTSTTPRPTTTTRPTPTSRPTSDLTGPPRSTASAPSSGSKPAVSGSGGPSSGSPGSDGARRS